MQYALDVHTLLHIRNFWDGHLIDGHPSFGERTYETMARRLARVGCVPSKLHHPLQEPVAWVSGQWMGHCSCLNPWPKKREDLKARHSCAEGIGWGVLLIRW